MHIFRMIAMSFALVSVAACENPGLRVLDRPESGPDEFLVNPTKPLEAPQSYTDLPTPTLGQGNRVDPTPLEDSIRALGGRPNAATSIPASDRAVVTYASRLGVTPNVRADLAERDEKFRKHQARFTQIRLAKKDKYNKAYKHFALDPYATARNWRAHGAVTPSAP